MNECEKDLLKTFELIEHSFIYLKVIDGNSSIPADFQVVSVNRNFQELIGFSPVLPEGKMLSDIIPEIDAQLKNTYISSPSYVLEMQAVEFKIKDGYGKTLLCKCLKVGTQNLAVIIQKENNCMKDYSEEVINYISDPIFVKDRQHRWLWANDALCSSFGKSRDEIIGKFDTELFPSSQAEIFIERDDFVFATESENSHEEEITSADGTKFSAMTKKKFFKDKNGRELIVGIVRDITKRKTIEETLQENERRFSTLIENLPGMVYRCKYDKNWTMEFLSGGCYELTGYYPESLIGNKELSYFDIISDQYKSEVRKKCSDAIDDNERFSIEYAIKMADGSEKWVQEKGCGVYSEIGEIIAIEGYITELTDKVQLEKTLPDS